MMKCEFETMIGKEISEETFKIYNEMYLATPATKQEFVKMLNIDAIPESEEAIERRRKANEFKQGIKNKIEEIKGRIEDCKWWLEIDPVGKSYWKSEIRRYKNEIATLKLVIA